MCPSTALASPDEEGGIGENRLKINLKKLLGNKCLQPRRKVFRMPEFASMVGGILELNCNCRSIYLSPVWYMQTSL